MKVSFTMKIKSHVFHPQLHQYCRHYNIFCYIILPLSNQVCLHFIWFNYIKIYHVYLCANYYKDFFFAQYWILKCVRVTDYLEKKKNSNRRIGILMGWYDIFAKNQELKGGSYISLLRMWLWPWVKKFPKW